jgi:hypothetical protein
VSFSTIRITGVGFSFRIYDFGGIFLGILAGIHQILIWLNGL